eukprot:jgi/Pico_ML_1/52356/g3069.t1
MSPSNGKDGVQSGDKKGLSEAQTTFGFSRDFDKDFRLGKILGRGSFGTVYAVHPTTKSKYAGRNDLAVKVVNKISFKNEKEVYWLKQEITIMRTLSNSLNIVNLYDTYENPGRVYILMEKCTGKRGEKCTYKDVFRRILSNPIELKGAWTFPWDLNVKQVRIPSPSLQGRMIL